MTSWLGPVAAALDAHPGARVFFRDDDAGWDDARLFDLLDLFDSRGVPLDLAVIPEELDAGLARALSRGASALHQHGFAHVNHEREGRKCEFGPARDVVDQVRDIVAGQQRMRVLLGDRVDPIFTPPWNRCTPDTGRALAPLGFEVLSRESRAEPLGEPGLLELPVSVDFVRLDAGRGGDPDRGRPRPRGPGRRDVPPRGDGRRDDARAPASCSTSWRRARAPRG